jgi:DNA-binding MarR family transcriptional regulator
MTVRRVFVDLENLSHAIMQKHIVERYRDKKELVLVFALNPSLVSRYRSGGWHVANSYPKGKNQADFAIMAELGKQIEAANRGEQFYLASMDNELRNAFYNHCRIHSMTPDLLHDQQIVKSTQKSHGWQLCVKPNNIPQNTTKAETKVLRLLDRSKGPVTAKLIRSKLQLSAHECSVLIQNLQMKKYIFKSKSPGQYSATTQIILSPKSPTLSTTELRALDSLTEPLSFSHWRKRVGMAPKLFLTLVRSLLAKGYVKRSKHSRYTKINALTC